MTSGVFLSTTAVALILAGTFVLTLLAEYFTQRLGSERSLLLWLVVIWVLMSVLAFTMSPSKWPNQTM